MLELVRSSTDVPCMLDHRYKCDCSLREFNRTDLHGWVNRLRHHPIKSRFYQAVFERNGWKLDYASLVFLLSAPHRLNYSPHTELWLNFPPIFQGIRQAIIDSRVLYMESTDLKKPQPTCTVHREWLKTLHPPPTDRS